VPFGFFQRRGIYSDAHRCFFKWSSGFSSSPPEKSPPEAQRNDEPDEEETAVASFVSGFSRCRRIMADQAWRKNATLPASIERASRAT